MDQEGFYADLSLLPIEELPAWKHIHNDFLTSFQSLWACVTSSLCADAPEGHVPDEFDVLFCSLSGCCILEDSRDIDETEMILFRSANLDAQDMVGECR